MTAARLRGGAGLAPPAFLLVLILAGCAPVVQDDHLRLCRALLPALHEDGAAIRETRYAPVPGRPNAVRIDYLATDPGRPASARYAVCGFAGGGAEPSRFVLATLETERGPVGAAKLAILGRWWLDAPSVLAAEAARRQAEAAVPAVPPALAYAVQQGANALVPATLYGLLAAAYALVYGLVGRINLAFGDIAVAGSYAALGTVAALAGAAGLVPALILALTAAAASAAAASLASGRLVLMPLAGRRQGGQAPLIATVGLAVALAEALRLAQGSGAHWAPPVGSRPVPLVRAGDFVATATAAQVGIALVALTAAAGLVALIRLTRFGRAWRAFCDDAGMAVLSGVDPARLAGATFALAGAAAGLAGFAHAVHVGATHFALGTVFGLKALTAAVLGGIGSVPGALLGGVALGLGETLWSAYCPIEWRDVAMLAALAAAMVVRGRGFLGSTGRDA